MTQSLNSAPQKQKFSVAINSKMYQNLIASTLRDPARARRFTAAITSAVAVNPALQECDAGTILAGALLGESLNLSPSPQLGQYYLVPFKQKAKYDRGGNMIRPETTTATFVLGYKGYIQLGQAISGAGRHTHEHGQSAQPLCYQFCVLCGREEIRATPQPICGI